MWGHGMVLVRMGDLVYLNADGNDLAEKENLMMQDRGQLPE
jgi:hypothetical protein